MMKMIKEGTEQLSKQISSNINNFIAHQKTASNFLKKTRAFTASQGKQNSSSGADTSLCLSEMLQYHSGKEQEILMGLTWLQATN